MMTLSPDKEFNEYIIINLSLDFFFVIIPPHEVDRFNFFLFRP